MHKFVFSFILVLLTGLVGAQDVIQLKGVLLRSAGEYAAGDTITLVSQRMKFDGITKQYGYISYGNRKFIDEDRVTILNPEMDFWEEVWFTNRADEITKVGWEQEKRQELYEDAMDYYTTALKNNLIFEDELLSDYLYQLTLAIHPFEMLKERQRNFSILVLKSPEETSFAFDNGMIVLTTGLLATLKTEEQLIHLLAENISHVVLEHNLINFNRALKAERNARIWGTITAVAAATAMAVDEVNTGRWHDYGLAADLGASVYFLSRNTRSNIGAEYTMEQRNLANKTARQFLRTYPEVVNHDEIAFITQLAPAISVAAWTQFHFKHYGTAYQMIQRLEDHGLTTDMDYFLMSRIIRKQYNDLESNQLALAYIEKGRAKSWEEFPELYKEEGLIYQRLGEFDKAIEAFSNYRNHLSSLRDKGQFVDLELRSIDQFIQRTSNLSKRVTEKQE
ncbi:M48 family metalloprotease [Mongoliitalea daihaiensis]|uniref:M48 family metalloprotease n=1 Tax=Mongoliitalea daihaiensis TaxID=2782006 RepID=UPI001F3A110F|nr:M48 family metalloprotease [Mongoliitalea daihaiensis]UJP65423.1 M48 family metalloprotease [Mongoliitalea daihaiensis]